MPTGYTAPVQSGEIKTLEQFVMTCVKAFGVCLELRDSPDAEVPTEFVMSDYHSIKLKEAQAKLDEIRAMSGEEIIHAEEEDWVEKRLDYASRVKKMAVEEDNYKQMIKLVSGWNPPPKFFPLKEFMLDQLKIGLEFDIYKIDPPIRFTTARDWHTKQIEDATWNVEYHFKHELKDQNTTIERNTYLRELREAIK